MSVILGGFSCSQFDFQDYEIPYLRLVPIHDLLISIALMLVNEILPYYRHKHPSRVVTYIYSTHLR